MKLYKQFLFVVLLLPIISTHSSTALAKNYTHQIGNQKIVFHIDDAGTIGTIVHLDENQIERIIAHGKITALTRSTNNPQLDQVVSTEKTTQGDILVKDDFKTPSAMAVIDGKYIIITPSGSILPLPFIKDPSANQWNLSWAVNAYTFGDGTLYYVLLKSSSRKTTLAIIRAQDGAYQSRSFSNPTPSVITFLNHTPVVNSIRKLTLQNEETQDYIRDVSGNYVDFIPLAGLQALTAADQIGAPLDHRLTAPEQGQQPAEEVDYTARRRFLESRIIGQPEAIDLIIRLERKHAFYGGVRQFPEKIYLMGLPGTGKDTIAEAWTDMLNGMEKGATKEHLHKLPLVVSKADLWSIQGSSTGYIGSEDLSDTTKWLVKHSAGKYKIERAQSATGKEKFFVVENLAWKPGMVLDGYTAPEKGIIFVNEGHNWAKKQKDAFLKQFIEKGIFHINNPGEGVKTLEVPVTFVFASNEGINLIAPRKENGDRIIKNMTDEQLLENWTANHNKPERLIAELMATNGASNEFRSEESPGNSEEFVSRFKKSSVLLLRPLSKIDLRKIVVMKLQDLKDAMVNATLTWTDALINFVVDHEYDGERGARPLDDNIDTLVEDPLLLGAEEGKFIKPTGKAELNLDVVANSDRTSSLVVKTANQTVALPIAATEKFRPIPPKTDAELSHIMTLPTRLGGRVFGAEHVAQAIGDDILVSEEGRNSYVDDPEKAKDPAIAYMFLGPSSTGKTAMAEAIAIEHMGSKDKMDVENFNAITSHEAMQAAIMGSKTQSGKPIRSQFMEKHDAFHGRFVSVWDEFANAGKVLTRAVYDPLREPVVRSFSDGKARAMSGTVIIMTGNAGEEWYQGIPKEAPEMQQQFAREEIYKQAMENPGFRRQTLETHFSEALLNRVGEERIIFFPSLTFKAIREVTQLKLLQALKGLETGENRRDFKVQFATTEDYTSTLESIESDGYIIAEQGASIDRFVNKNFGTNLRALLLKKLVPHQANVVLQRMDDSPKSENQKGGAINYKIYVNGEDRNIVYSIPKRFKPFEAQFDVNDQHLTAMHEAGHNLVTSILMGEHYKPERITVIPGVTNINNHFIMYLGLAESEETKRFMWTKEAVLREMAVLWGGTVAQELTSDNFASDAGKSNDAERATQYAQTAILKWGLSSTWGTETVPRDMSINDFIASMSEPKRIRFEKAIDEFMKESRNMAEAVILTNMRTGLIPLGLELIRKGDMKAQDLGDFYAAHKPKLDYTAFESLMDNEGALKSEKLKWKDPIGRTGRTMSAKLSSLIPKPEYTANIDDLIKARRAETIAQVAVPENLPISHETYVSLRTTPKVEEIVPGLEKKSAEIREAQSGFRTTIKSCTSFLAGLPSIHRRK